MGWGGQAGSPAARLRSLPHSVVFGRPQCRHPRACSLSAPARHRLPSFPGGPSCAARKQRRRRGESGRDASRPAPTERAYVRVSERATLSPVPPTARRAVARSGRSGHPGYCFGPAAAPDPRGTSGLPHARPGAQRAGPVGTELMGSSPAPRKVAPRGGGGGWWAEAVGGGGDRPPISPKSKVLGGAVSRAPETRLPPPPPPARQSAPLRRAATPSACLVAAACAPGRVRLGAGRGGCSLDLPQGGGPDPGPWRSSAPGRTHPPAVATASRRTQSSAIRPSSPGAGGPCHPAPTADSPLPPPFSLSPTPLPIPMPPPQPGSLGRGAHSD